MAGEPDDTWQGHRDRWSGHLFLTEQKYLVCSKITYRRLCFEIHKKNSSEKIRDEADHQETLMGAITDIHVMRKLCGHISH